MPDNRTIPHPVPSAADLCHLDAAALAEAYGSGHLSPVEVVQAALARAEEIQPALNAFTFLDHERALDAARASEQRWRRGEPLSPIDGVPATLKDIVEVEGWRVTYGSKATDPAPKAVDAPSVARLRAAGTVFIGQTTTPEFGWKALTDSAAFGITRNPLDPGLTPGGSSGGAAVASAVGAGVLHLGTDGGGSIRIPAAFTGTFGHKPSYGRVAAHPPSSFGSVAHIGPMTRKAADARLMLAAMSGHDLRDWTQPWGLMPDLTAQRFSWKGRRIGLWLMPPTGETDPAIASVIETAARRIEAEGAMIELIALPGEDLHRIFHAHWMTGAANRLSQIPKNLHALIDPGFLDAADEGKGVSMLDYVGAQLARTRFGAAMDRLLAEYDLLISPATAVLPFAVGLEVPAASGLARWTDWAGFSYPVNLSQQPASVLPCGDANGLPVGLQLIGPRGADGFVLDAATAAEQLFGGRVA